jgi:glycine/D-amino acid oxidase-like deaminating enzyme
MKISRQPFDPGISGWDAILPKAQNYPALETAITADWLVIGAGFAGLSAAFRLRQLHPTDRIALLEARRVAEGPAGRNSGFMIDLPHNLASSDYAGALEADRVHTRMNRRAIAFAHDLASGFKFDKEAVVQSGKINAAAGPRGLAHNTDYATHLSRLGEPHEMLDAAQMKSVCGSSYYIGGLFTPGTTMLQPALYIRNLATALHRLKVQVFEASPVTELNRSGSNWIASTPKGSVEAPRAILAVNGHAESFGYFRRRLMHIYLYASMTAPLSRDQLRQLGGEAKWAFTPADPMGSTIRKHVASDGTRIVVRNGFTWSPGRTVNPAKLASIGKAHDQSFARRFSMLKDVSMQYRWGGLLCLSRNDVAAFGEVAPQLYSACCQNGLGAAKGTIHGILAADQASDERSDMLDHLLAEPAPQKLPPEPFSSIGANAYLHWSEFRAGAEL